MPLSFLTSLIYWKLLILRQIHLIGLFLLLRQGLFFLNVQAITQVSFWIAPYGFAGIPARIADSRDGIVGCAGSAAGLAAAAISFWDGFYLIL